MQARLRILHLVCLSAALLTACAVPASTTVTVPLTGTPEAAITSPPPTSPPLLSGRVRQAAVAGSWYPNDPATLTRLIDEMLATVEPVDGEPIGLIVPHAGYIYSGPTAATGFRQLEGVGYDVAIIVASDHRPPVSQPISVWAEGGFATPLGVVPVDVELAQALISADKRIKSDPAAHEEEHTIEIELPFLQRVCPDCTIVPILMGRDDEETIQALVTALLAVLQNVDRRVVLIASSDLSHYPSYDDALAVDSATLAAIETFEPARVRETLGKMMVKGIPNLVTCACSEGPILVVMHVAKALGADTATVLGYANSGDVSGDHSQVVGYGSVMFWHYEAPALTDTQRQELLKLARETIAEYLKTGHTPGYESTDPLMNRRAGVFVTLKERGELRGCIGHTRADLPLYRAVQQMAIAAATGDPRFPPLKPEEIDDISIEISILSPMRRVTDLEQIEVGTHGLVIIKGGHQGLLLPQVPVEQGWGRQEYLANLCLKAGLTPECWTEQPTLYSFTAVVFGE